MQKLDFVVFGIAILLTVVTIVVSLRLANQEPDGMGRHLPTLAGCFAAFGCWFMPWVGLAIFDMLAVLGRSLPELLGKLMRLLGFETFGSLLERVKALSGIPGTLLPFILVFADERPAALAVVLVPVVSSCSALWLALLLIFSPGQGMRRVMGGLQAFFALFAALLLLLAMPAIDALGLHGDLTWQVAMVFSGVYMTGWVWVTWCSLVLIGVGGLRELIGGFSPLTGGRST